MWLPLRTGPLSYRRLRRPPPYRNHDLQNAALWQPNKFNWNIDQCRILVAKYDGYLKRLTKDKGGKPKENSSRISASKACVDRILSAEVVVLAFKFLIKSKVDTPAD